MKSNSTQNFIKINNLSEFYSTLEGHDWTYIYSSDHRAYSRGQNESNRIREAAKDCPQALALYVAYSEHVYNGKPKPSSPIKFYRKKEAERVKFINRLNSVLETLYLEPNTSISVLAKSVAVSERQLYRKVKAFLHATPTEYLRRYRLYKAKGLLDRGKSVTYSAYESGFSCQSYFGRCFKKQFGISPSGYRKSRLLIN